MSRPKIFLLIFFLQLFSFVAAAQVELDDELYMNVSVQILLDRAGFSPGEIDGKFGSNTSKALFTFQAANGLPRTGEPDDRTIEMLTAFGEQLLTTYTLTEADLRGPFTQIPPDFMDKAKLPHLQYSSPLEAISEKFHMSPELFTILNPEVLLEKGEVIAVPNVFRRSSAASNLQGTPAVARVKGSVKTGRLTVLVSAANSDLMVTRDGKVIFYAPISHGGERDPVPVGKQKIAGVISNPVYRYNPELFWDADPSHTKAVIRPGPNNPVGLVWIGLNVPHYGLHGTPEPSRIGYGQSHGCIRMTNWDALTLASLVQPGTEVIFQ